MQVQSLGGGNGNPLQYSCLENSMDRGAWWAIVHRVAKSKTGLSSHTRNISYYLVQFSSVTQSCSALSDPMNCSMPGFPVHHQLLELAQIHVHHEGDAIQPSHPLSSPSSPALNLSQHQSLFKWVSSSHQEANVLEFQLQHQYFQWTFRTDFQSKGFSRVFSNTTVQKHQFFSAQFS